MTAIKHFVENHFNTVMLISIAIGLFLPGLDLLPNYTVMGAIMLVIFFSCSKVSLDELNTVNKTAAIIFYALRFIVLPVPAYYLTLQLSPQLADGVLLLALMPTGVSCAAVANIMRGNTSFALIATIITHILAPITIPVLIGVLLGEGVELDLLHMAFTLILTIFLPACTYFWGIRKSTTANTWTKNNAQFFAVLFTGLIVILGLALKRHEILDNPMLSLPALLANIVLYTALYSLVWITAAAMPFKDRKTFTLCSGVNNNGLAIGIAALYFSPLTLLVCVLSEIIWPLAITSFGKFIRIAEKKEPPI